MKAVKTDMAGFNGTTDSFGQEKLVWNEISDHFDSSVSCGILTTFSVRGYAPKVKLDKVNDDNQELISNLT